MQADGPVLVIGFVLVVALAAEGRSPPRGVAARSFGHVRPAPTLTAGGPRAGGAPVPVAVGTRFALERGSGPQSVPVLPALSARWSA